MWTTPALQSLRSSKNFQAGQHSKTESEQGLTAQHCSEHWFCCSAMCTERSGKCLPVCQQEHVCSGANAVVDKYIVQEEQVSRQGH